MNDDDNSQNSAQQSTAASASSSTALQVEGRYIPDSELPTKYVEGLLYIANEGSGLLRRSYNGTERDVYISGSQIRRFQLRNGDLVGGQAREPKENERYWGLLKVEK